MVSEAGASSNPSTGSPALHCSRGLQVGWRCPAARDLAGDGAPPPALTFQDGHIDLGLVLGVGEALLRRLTAANAAGPGGQPLLGTASLLLPWGPRGRQKAKRNGELRVGTAALHGARPALCPHEAPPSPGPPHLAAWCWDGASSGSMERPSGPGPGLGLGLGLGLVWLPAGEGSDRQESSRTPSTPSPFMLQQRPVRHRGWLRGWQSPAAPRGGQGAGRDPAPRRDGGAAGGLCGSPRPF